MKSLYILIISITLLLTAKDKILAHVPINLVHTKFSNYQQILNPLLEKYSKLEKDFDVDLSHTYIANMTRFPKKFYDLDVFNNENFTEQFDVLILGDSTQAWGLDTITVSKTSGLKVGHFAYESHLLTPISSSFYQLIVPCIVKKEGIILISYASNFLNVDPNDKRYWLSEQQKFIDLDIDSCTSIKKYFQKRYSKQEKSILNYKTWLRLKDTYGIKLEMALPKIRHFIPIDFFIDKKKNNENEQDSLKFISTPGPTITLTNEIQQFPINLDLNKVNSKIKFSTKISENHKKNIESLKPLEKNYSICFVNPLSITREREFRLKLMARFLDSDCFFDFNEIIINYSERTTFQMQSNYHYGNETGQIMSIALGKYLKDTLQK